MESKVCLILNGNSGYLVQNVCIFFRQDDPDYQPPAIDSTETEEAPQQNSKRGRPEKAFLDCNASSKRSKLDPHVEKLRNLSKRMGIHFDDLLYYLGKRNAYQTDNFDTAKFYEDLLTNGIDTSFKKVTPERAMLLKQELSLSRNKYVTLYEAVEKVFPTKYSLEKLSKEMKVPLYDFMDGKKANFSETIAKTLERHIKAEEYVPDSNSTSFKVKITAGFDGYVHRIYMAFNTSFGKVQNYL